jgi:hypothetical protein
MSLLKWINFVFILPVRQLMKLSSIMYVLIWELIDDLYSDK